MNMFARFDKNPAMTLQDIKKTKRYGRTHGRTDGQRESSIPTTNKVCGGIKKPKFENLTLSQWSVANLAILNKLVADGKLKDESLMDYLSYSTKIYQLVQKCSLASVLLYDREPGLECWA